MGSKGIARLLAGVVGVSALAVGPATAEAAFVVAGPSEALSSSSGAWNWETGANLADYKAALQNPAYFGPGGAVETALTLQTLTTIDAASLAGVDLVVVPWWYDSQATPAQVDAIKTYFLGGGNLLLLDDSSSNDPVGEALGLPSSSSDASVSNGGAPLFDGPFGTAANVTQSGDTGRLSAADVTAANGTVAATNAAGQITAAVWAEGQYAPTAGALVLLGDVDMISSNYGTATYAPLNDNGRFALNATAFAVAGGEVGPPAAVPLPAAVWTGLATLAAAGAAQARRRLVRA